MSHADTATPPSPSGDRYRINAVWLMKLRWVALAGQLTTIGIVAIVLRITVQVTPLIVALAVTAVTNFLFMRWLHRLNSHGAELPAPANWHRVFMSLMVLDLVVLSLLLYFTGGHANPFGLFYFVNLALSGILLPPSRAWLLNGLSAVCFAGLFYYQIPLVELQQAESLRSVKETGAWTLGHRGLLASFWACSAVIVYFVTRLNAELERGDQALRILQEQQASNEKWEALGTLSAGAAHELASPLTTIAIVSTEMQQELKSRELPTAIVQDVAVIRREVDRCRAILDRMSIDAGHAIGEQHTAVDADGLVLATLREMTENQHRIRISIDDAAKATRVDVPLHSVCQALRGVIQNALDASKSNVQVNVKRQGDDLQIAVKDEGTGMSEEILRRADEPFFTTKEAGRGMGLGRFLARTIFERLGGNFSTESSVGVGTTVTIEIPTSEAQHE